MSIKLDPDSALGKALAELWLGLKDDSGARAQLRRCDDVAEVMMTPSFNRFCHRVKGLFEGEMRGWEVRLAMVVGLMAHLKHDHSSTVLSSSKGLEKSFAALFVVPMAEGDRPRVSELRFRRLLQRDASDLYPAMIRVLRMLDGSANLYGLAESVYCWDDKYLGDKVRKEWSYAYFPRVPERKSA